MMYRKKLNSKLVNAVQKSLLRTSMPVMIVLFGSFFSASNTYAQMAPNGTDTDWDGDGIINTVDLDDDNDGLLDALECSATTSETQNLTAWTRDKDSTTYDFYDTDVTIDGNNIGYSYGGGDVPFDPPLGEHEIYFSERLASYGYADDYVIETTVSMNGDAGVEFAIAVPEADDKVGASNTPKSWYGVKSQLGGALWQFWRTDASGSSVSANAGGATGSVNLKIEKSGNTFKFYVGTRLAGQATLTDEEISKVRLMTGLQTHNVSGANFQNVRITGTRANVGNDVDGDGIDNCFDNDSDGDSCPDAVEGSAGIMPANVTAGQITGGVSSTGIPTLVDDGQELGTSMYALTSKPSCATYAGTTTSGGTGEVITNDNDGNDNDGDGIADSVDLDDDNDGISDITEGLTCGISGAFSELSGVDGVPSSSKVYQSSLTDDLKVRVTFDDYTTYWDEDYASASINNGEFMDDSCSGLTTDFPPLNLTDGKKALKVSSGRRSSQNASGVAKVTVEYLNANGDLVKVNDSRVHHLGIGGSQRGNAQSMISAVWNFVGVTPVLLSAESELSYSAANKTIENSRAGEAIGSATFSCKWNEGSGTFQINEGVSSYEFEVVQNDLAGNVDWREGDAVDLVFEGCSGKDTDGDGIPDYLDNDSDNDGISDLVEAGGVEVSDMISLATNNPQGTYPASLISGSGLASSANSGSGYAVGSSLALDRDGDGIPDAIEAQPTAAGEYVSIDEENAKTSDVGVDVLYIPQDTDGDNIPDFVDEDSDNDGAEDIVERDSSVTISPTYAATDGGVEPSQALANQLGDRSEVAYREFLAELQLVKESTVTGLGNAGDVVSYKFVVTNVGSVTITTVTVTDELTGNTGSNTLEVVSSKLEPGEVGEAFASYTITQDDVDAGAISNSATAEGFDPSENSIKDTSSTTALPTANTPTITDLTQTATLQLLKTSSVTGGGDVDDVIHYQFTVINTGNVTISSVTITDAKISSSSITVSPSVLAPGATGIVRVPYTITQADKDAGMVVNTAVVTGTDPNGDAVTDTSSSGDPTEDLPTTTTLSQSPELQLVKSSAVSGDGGVGDTITYTFVVENTGDVSISSITITDEKLTPSEVAIDVDKLAPGATATATAVYVITQDDLDAGAVTNSATVAGSDPQGNTITDTSSTTDDPSGNSQTVTNLTQTATIEFVKTGSVEGDGNVGDTITYTFLVTNTGNVTVDSVTITDARLGVTDLLVSPSTLAPSETGTATAVYNITQDDLNAGQVTNSATAVGKDPDGGDVTDTSSNEDNPGGDSETVTTLTQTAELEFVKSSSVEGGGNVGDTITYTFLVTNTGNVTIDSVTITDARIGVTDLAVSPSTLDPGETGTATAVYNITQDDLNAGQVTNSATAVGKDPDGGDVTDTSSNEGNPGGDSETVTTLTQTAELEFVKSSSVEGGGNVGDTITYTFLVTNTGNVTVDSVTITDARIGVTDLAVSPSTLDPGETGTATAVYNITQDDLDAGQVTNSATAVGKDPDGGDVTDTSSNEGNPGGDSETVTTLTQTAEIEFVKSGSAAGDGNVGDTITYTFLVTNTGNVTVSDITITDARIGVTDLAVSPTSLAPGETGTATAVYNITQDDLDAGQVTNSATAVGKDPDGGDVTDTSSNEGNPGGDSETVTTLTQTAEIEFVKSGSAAGDGNVGDTITYTFLVTNTGNVTVSDITITDARIGVTDLAVSPTSLAPGETGTATAVYNITQDDLDAGQVTNSATAVGKDPDGGDVTDTSSNEGNPGGDSETVTTLTQTAEIEFVKSGSAAGDGNVGDTITYTFLVTNTGNVTVSDITITDARIGVTDLAVSPTSLAPGETGTATAVYNITQDDLDAGQVTNSATAVGKDPDGGDVTDTSSNEGNPGGDSETVTTLTQTAELEFVKSGVVEGQGREGETITYTFLVTNTGNITVNNITISDSKLGITDLAISPSTLKPGETGTATAVYAISSTDVEAGEVSNSAIATGTDPAGNNVTDTSSNVDNPTKDSETITNLPPQAVDDTQTTTAGVPVVINIVDNDIAPNGPVTAAIVTPPGIGTATVSVVDGKPVVTYDAPAGTTGTVSFTYVITDANGLTSTATVVVSLSNPLDAVNDTASVTTGSSVTVSVLNNDDYPVGLTTEGVTIVGIDGLGTATVTDDNKIVYEAPLNQTTTTTITYQICDTTGQCDTATVTVAVQATEVFIKVSLLGALIGESGSIMQDKIREAGYLPTTTPYLDSTNFGNFVSKGLSEGGEQVTDTAFDDRDENSVVDWVFVQFRDSADSETVKETRSALVQRDGDVVDVDGVSPLRFPGNYVGSSYFISVRHRNHMGAMSSEAIELGKQTTYDFTVDAGNGSKFYETASQYDGLEQVKWNGIYALWAGNANGDDRVKYQGAATDLNRISGEVRIHEGNTTQQLNYDNALGYYNGDVNLDGKVKYQGTEVDTNIVLGVILNIYPLNIEAKQFNYDLAIEQLPNKN